MSNLKAKLKNRIERLKYIISDMPFLYTVVIVVIVNLIWCAALVKTISADNKEIDYAALEKKQDIAKLELTFKAYKNLSGKQLHVIWNDIFYGIDYKLGGNLKEKQSDCTTAMWEFFRYVGSNIKYEDTTTIKSRFQKSGRIPCKNIIEIKTGDIIIFHKTEGYGHIAIVERINLSTGIVYYLDINARTRGPGYDFFKFGDPRIDVIYNMTFDYWCGDVLSR